MSTLIYVLVRINAWLIATFTSVFLSSRCEVKLQGGFSCRLTCRVCTDFANMIIAVSCITNKMFSKQIFSFCATRYLNKAYNIVCIVKYLNTRHIRYIETDLKANATCLLLLTFYWFAVITFSTGINSWIPTSWRKCNNSKRKSYQSKSIIRDDYDFMEVPGIWKHTWYNMYTKLN